MCSTFAEGMAVMASTPVFQLVITAVRLLETLFFTFYAHFTFEHVIACQITRSAVGTIHSIILWDTKSLQTFQRNLLRPSSNKPLFLTLLTFQSLRLTQLRSCETPVYQTIQTILFTFLRIFYEGTDNVVFDKY
jgi:hypothetical protein